MPLLANKAIDARMDWLFSTFELRTLEKHIFLIARPNAFCHYCDGRVKIVFVIKTVITCLEAIDLSLLAGKLQIQG